MILRITTTNHVFITCNFIKVKVEENNEYYRSQIAARNRFGEQKRREGLLVRMSEYTVDSAERLRIMEELYEWFMITKDFVVLHHFTL